MTLQILAAVATGLLAGGMTFFSFVFAPLVFKKLPAETAGAFIAAVFPVYYAAGLALSALAAGLAAAPAPGEAALLAAVAVLFAVARFGLMPAIEARRDASRAGEPAARAIFRRLHGISMVVNLVQMIAAIAVLGLLSGS